MNGKRLSVVTTFNQSTLMGFKGSTATTQETHLNLMNKKHSFSHSGLRSLACSMRSGSFSQSLNLWNHLLSWIWAEWRQNQMSMKAKLQSSTRDLKKSLLSWALLTCKTQWMLTSNLKKQPSYLQSRFYKETLKQQTSIFHSTLLKEFMIVS